MFYPYTLQVVLTFVAALVVWLWQGTEVVGPVVFGGSTALINTGMLVWRWRQGRYDYHCDGERHLRQFYRSSLERFFVVAIFLAVGMFGLRMSPLPLLLGFVVGQVAWIIAAASLRTD
jgi:ATP synthase protein I